MSDVDVLALREEGLSFAAIASRLGLRRSRDALDGFYRALHLSDATVRPELLRRELARLAALETRIRSRDANEPRKMEHRLAALEEMRARLSRAADG